MKSVLITFDQAYYERIMALLDRLGCRGFTYLEKVQGRGSKTGDPHFGSHAWPSMCSAILTVVEDNKLMTLNVLFVKNSAIKTPLNANGSENMMMNG